MTSQTQGLSRSGKAYGRDRRGPVPGGGLRTLPDGTDVIVEVAEAQPLTSRFLFGDDRPLEVEIGPGKGEFLLEMARACPETGFLAIEYKRIRVEKIATRIVRALLTNVRLIWEDARTLIGGGFPPGSVSALYVNFPDPWPKRRHRRRRLLSEEVLTHMATALGVDGTLTIGTDVDDYAQQIVRALEDCGRFVNVLGRGVIVDRLEGYTPTVFEARFREQGLPVHFVRYRRLPDPA